MLDPATLDPAMFGPAGLHAAARHAIHGAIKASGPAAFKTFDSPSLNEVDY
jgi:hypothetical protein